MQHPAPAAPPGLHFALNVEVLTLVADSVICTDEDGRILVFNPAAEQTFGYSAGEVIGQPVEMLLPQGDRLEHVRQVRGFALGDGAANRLMGHRREVRGRRKNGEEFPAEAMVSRQTLDGRTILTVVHRDITERKELETLREAVARELDHRMRNLLSVVNSLVSISAASAVTVDEFRDSLIGRLTALAATQGALRFGEQGASLGELVLAELAQYRTPGGGNVVIEGPPVSVGPKAAQILALAVHELATNAAKYGALSSAGGRVAVTSAFKDEGGKGLLVIQWRETGGPPVKQPDRQGFGTRLIKQVVAKALRAEVVLDYRPEGLVCQMTVPRAAVEAGL
ncbi:MAG: PAS domain S-box protein [Brevundimonas sp.]